jgi:hypothetical protein
LLVHWASLAMPLTGTGSAGVARLDSELEASLDWLGMHPLDAVPFALNPAFAAPQALMAETERLLATPLPGAQQLASGAFNYDAGVERQVIEQVSANFSQLRSLEAASPLLVE